VSTVQSVHVVHEGGDVPLVWWPRLGTPGLRVLRAMDTVFEFEFEFEDVPHCVMFRALTEL
jgi:hypothetical protein